MSMRRDHARCLITFDDELLHKFTDAWAELAPEVLDCAVLLQSCVDRLATQAKTMVKLRYHEDLNSEEIATRLGRNSAAVRVALQRILDRIRYKHRYDF